MKPPLVMVSLLMLTLAAGIACSGSGTPTGMGSALSDATPIDRVASARNSVESAYPEFKGFENQESFAGQAVKSEMDGTDYYVAYIVKGSGLPIAQATCFRVDRTGRAFKVGLFPDPLDSYAGYRDVNPKDCSGIK